MMISLSDSITDDQRKFLKDAKQDLEETGLEVETTLADLDPSKPTDIIEMQMVINSICMISKRTGNGGATGFLANDPDLGIIYLDLQTGRSRVYPSLEKVLKFLIYRLNWELRSGIIRVP